MSRFFTLSAALLMLALVSTVPAVAQAPDVPAEPVQAEPLQDLELAEEPLMTPAEQPEAPDLLNLKDLERENQLRACDPPEEAQCAPGCCIFVRNAVFCFC